MQFQDISEAQAAQYKSLLRLRGSYQADGHLRMDLHTYDALKGSDAIAWLQTHGQHIKQAVTGRASTTTGPALTQPPLRPQQSNASLPAPASSGGPLMSPGGTSVTTIVQPQSSSSITVMLRAQAYILFGSRRSRPPLNISHLDMAKYGNDASFFCDLKAHYRSARGLLRCCFSIWQLRHCTFSNVSYTAIVRARY